MKLNRLFCAAIIVPFFFISCTSIQQPQEVSEPLDYSDENVKRSEIAKIRELQLTEPVKALWRAHLLNDEKIITECTELCKNKMNEYITSNDVLSAQRYYSSLVAAGWDDEKSVRLPQISDVPGLALENPYAPKTIEDCMNTTVTIWVDRGWKVTNGAGTVDIVIGSGFFIDRRGYLITNHHVIESMVDGKYEGYTRLYIKLLSDPDTKIPAKVVGYDPTMDLALLKVEITPEFVFSLGSSSDLHIGDKVSAIGTPVGLEGTLTSGIISSTERKLLTLGNVFQIDAAVNSGNSGGPLIDEKLNVQAIVFAGMAQLQGLNFAIPVEYLKQELPLLYNNGEGGQVMHSWTGSYGHTKRTGNKKTGLEVQYVMPGGSSFMTGLREDDVITAIDGKKVNSLEDFQFIMLALQPQSIVRCNYLDSEENEKSALLYLDIRPEQPLKKIFSSDFLNNSFVPIVGMKLVRNSTESRNSYAVQKVIKGSIADQMSFSETDIIIVREVKFDDENEQFYAQIYCKRKQKGFLDASLVVGSSYDSPYYF